MVTKTANGNEAVIFIPKKQKKDKENKNYEEKNYRVILYIQEPFKQRRKSRN